MNSPRRTKASVGPDGPYGALKTVRIPLYLLGLGLFVCALLSKTATCLLVVAIPLLLWWRGRLSVRELLGWAPLLVVGVGFVGMTVYLESHQGGAQGEMFSQSWLERCLIGGRSLWFYAGKLVWPAGLSFIYPRWDVEVGRWWWYLYPITALVVLGALVTLRGRIGRGPLVAVLWFVLALLPISFVNVAFTRLSYVADHWQYWASMGLIALAAAALFSVQPRTRWPRWCFSTAGCVLVLTLSVATWHRSAVYESPRRLWQDTLARNPDAWAIHNNLGNAVLAEGYLEEAAQCYRRALSIKADYATGHCNLANVLQRQGRLDEAIDHFQKSIAFVPGRCEVYYNLANALYLAGRSQEAITQYERAIRIEPGFTVAYSNLGTALAAEGRLDEAIRRYEQALDIEPGLKGLDRNLRVAMKKKDAVVQVPTR